MANPDTAEMISGQMEKPVAIVDVGSGAVKLLIVDRAGLAAAAAATNAPVGAQPDGQADDRLAAEPGILFSTGLKTKLIAGSSDLISDEALAATADAFRSFHARINELAPGAAEDGRVRVVATAVAREASNLSALEAVAKESFGVDLEVLSGEREAELAFTGATHGRQIDGQVVVMDIGAGSTEFAYGTLTEGQVHALSLPVGGRSLIDSYLLSDPPRPEELSSALSVVELHIDDLRRELPGISDALDETVIVSGAMGQIAAVEIGLIDPDAIVDGEIIEKVGIEDLFRTLATESAEERLHNPGLKPEHVEDILGVICVLVEFMRQCGVAEVMVSERSVRHGLAAEMLGER